MDSLPDRFGNAIITAELTKRGATYSQITPLDRLAYMGKRSIGALEFKPAISYNHDYPDILNIAELVHSAREILVKRPESKLKAKSSLNPSENLISIGTSAGGARAKAVINIDKITGDISSGQFPSKGKEAWIIKFDGVENDPNLSGFYGRIEYIYSLMAKKADINMPETKLLKENGRAHFLVKRFERLENGEKLHYQSLCGIGILDYNAIGVNDYSSFIATVEKLHLNESELLYAKQEVFRRMVFNYLALNYDDHTKNFGFLMNQTGKWSLSPAFDVTFAYNSKSEWLKQHLMGVNGKFANVTSTDFINFARLHKIPSAKSIIDKVRDAVSDFEAIARKEDLEPSQAASITALLKDNITNSLK